MPDETKPMTLVEVMDEVDVEVDDAASRGRARVVNTLRSNGWLTGDDGANHLWTHPRLADAFVGMRDATEIQLAWDSAPGPSSDTDGSQMASIANKACRERDDWKQRYGVVLRGYKECTEGLANARERRDAAEAMAARLAEALRLTCEYVGTRLLPDVPGWSHHDALAAYRAHLDGHGRMLDVKAEPE